MKTYYILLLFLFVGSRIYCQEVKIEELKTQILKKVESDKNLFHNKNTLLDCILIDNTLDGNSAQKNHQILRFCYAKGYSIRFYLYSKSISLSSISIDIQKNDGDPKTFSYPKMETKPLVILSENTLDNNITIYDYQIKEPTSFIINTNFNKEGKKESYWLAITAHPN